MKRLWLTFSVILMVSCGKSVENKKDEESREEFSTDGTYSAILIPVNGRITSQVHGDVKINKYGDDFQVDVQLKNAPAGSLRQYIHVGSTCPRLVHDLNADGFIDAFESRAYTGHAIVPLDNDLSSQAAGSSFVLKGNYKYSRSTSYHLMLSDLHVADDVVNDFVIKLNDKDLPLERRAVVVHLVRRGQPDSVSGAEIPIACGVLTRISEVPPPSTVEWEVEEERPRRRVPRIPRRQPRPEPPPPEIEPPAEYNSWWDRIRQRWRRWRGGGSREGANTPQEGSLENH